MSNRQRWIPLWEQYPDEKEVLVKIVLEDNKFVHAVGHVSDEQDHIHVTDWPKARVVAWAYMPENRP